PDEEDIFPASEETDEDLEEEDEPDETDEKVVAPAPAKKPEPKTMPKPDFVTAAFGIPSPEKPKPAAPPPKKEEPEAELDLSGVAEGTAVQHKRFGEGTVNRFDKDKKYIRVQFKEGEKIFLFPDAFNQGFLKL
ncbi:MAG: hypothetical protein GX897_04630, partial [Clostridiales bacterium]|nr:hypothetical protein [Clostridiales bacterium]